MKEFYIFSALLVIVAISILFYFNYRNTSKVENFSNIVIEDGKRQENLTPSEYRAKGRGIYTEFKEGSSLNFTECGNPNYIVLKTIVPWHDPTGGNVIQLGFSGACIRMRTSLDEQLWSSWRKVSE